MHRGNFHPWRLNSITMGNMRNFASHSSGCHITISASECIKYSKAIGPGLPLCSGSEFRRRNFGGVNLNGPRARSLALLLYAGAHVWSKALILFFQKRPSGTRRQAAGKRAFMKMKVLFFLPLPALSSAFAPSLAFLLLKCVCVMKYKNGAFRGHCRRAWEVKLPFYGHHSQTEAVAN